MKEEPSVLDWKIDEAGCLDRASTYFAQEINRDLWGGVSGFCGGKECEAEDCDEDGSPECPGQDLMLRVEYDIQTKTILFAKKLVADWKAGSYDK